MTSSARYAHGVVIGKFLPPHRGHRHLIETALGRCHRVTVIICGKLTDPIPPEARLDWLRELCPHADIMLIDDRYDENDSKVWAENTILWLGKAPDAVFTSEVYGDAYAHHMGCKHELVDLARATIPCSGTAIRNDPFAHWKFIDPPVRSWFAKRIVLLGAESTGTTTLARDLAATMQTIWVPEYGREYSETKLKRGESQWFGAEFLHIAREQQLREDMAARNCHHALVCDTNAFATCMWHRRYMGTSNADLDDYVRMNVRADLYLLTGDEIPFIQDGLRDGEHIRHDMHTWFEEALSNQSTPWRIVRGSREQRLHSALSAIRELEIPLR